MGDALHNFTGFGVLQYPVEVGAVRNIGSIFAVPKTLLHKTTQLPKSDLSNQFRPASPDKPFRIAFQPAMQFAQIGYQFFPLKLASSISMPSRSNIRRRT